MSPRHHSAHGGSRGKPQATGAVSDGPPSWLSRLLQDHVRALSGTLAQMRAKPLGTLLTVFVLGITLALPAGLQALFSNLNDTGYRIGQRSLQATLFLKDSVDETQGRALATKIGKRDGVGSSHYLSRQDALKEFEAHSGAGETQALNLLDGNPLPASIIVAPDPHQPQAKAQALLKKLAGLPQVDQAQLDQQWLQRLYALLDLVRRVTLMVMAVLAASVVIVIANTIRLDIENRRDEIEVMKLVGAADAYVRRPLLYIGLCYGFAGALLALILVEIAVLFLQGAVQHLAGLYDAQAHLQGLSFQSSLILLGCGLGLGWIGAFWTVSRHLHRIEPR